MFPFFIPYPWNQDDVSNYFMPKKEDMRFGGILLPFIGGALLGGLFLPKPTTYVPYKHYPYGPVPTMMYYPPFLGDYNTQQTIKTQS